VPLAGFRTFLKGLDKMDKTIDYYMGLPYTIEMVPGLESGWVVSVRELPGCISQGDSPQNAVDMIREAMCGWLEIALEDGIPVPEPRPAETFSGKFVVRVPRSLHREMTEIARRESVSLNQFVSTALARAVGEEGAATTRLVARPVATSATAARLEEARSALGALRACLKRGDELEALRLAEGMGSLLQPDSPGAVRPEGRQEPAMPRGGKARKGERKPPGLSPGATYVNSPQSGAVCRADGGPGQPETDAAPPSQASQ
jgi:antitoxin HicB